MSDYRTPRFPRPEGPRPDPVPPPPDYRQPSTRTEPRTALRERLAALEHEQWMMWAGTLMGSEPGLSKDRMGRWQDLMVPYSALTGAQKDQDRKWADKVLAAIEAAAPAGSLDVEVLAQAMFEVLDTSAYPPTDEAAPLVAAEYDRLLRGKRDE